MKKLLAVFFAAGMAMTTYAATQHLVGVEIDGRPVKAEFKELNAPGMKIKSRAKTDKAGEMHYLTGEKGLTNEWQEYTFSFVPTEKVFIFGLRSWNKNVFIDYDDVKADNATIYNSSFEVVNNDNQIDGWRYYNPATLQAGKSDAADGKNYVTCSNDYSIRKTLRVEPGKKVTFSFKARIGKPLPAPPTAKWASDQNRKVF